MIDFTYQRSELATPYPVDEIVEVDLVDVDPAGAGGEDADVPMQRRSDLQVTVAADQSRPAPKQRVIGGSYMEGSLVFDDEGARNICHIDNFV